MNTCASFKALPEKSVLIIKNQKDRQEKWCRYKLLNEAYIFYNTLSGNLPRSQSPLALQGKHYRFQDPYIKSTIQIWWKQLWNETQNTFALNSQERGEKSLSVLRQVTQRKPSAQKKTTFVYHCLFGPGSGNGSMPKILLQRFVQ